jgi:AraC-like DNA-binding protein
VAAQLGLSARTLQRRLGEAGLSFQQLLERTRRELAAQYLAQDAFSLAEVAFLLGYTEQSSFTHAHRAWHGCTPQQARQRLLDGPAQV